jgi:hydrogenase maturation protease
LPVELFADASGHAWGLAQTLALGRVLKQLPPYLTIYGIEGRNFGLGQQLSPEVNRAIPEAARRISREIREYLGTGHL